MPAPAVRTSHLSSLHGPFTYFSPSRCPQAQVLQHKQPVGQPEDAEVHAGGQRCALRLLRCAVPAARALPPSIACLPTQYCIVALPLPSHPGCFAPILRMLAALGGLPKSMPCLAAAPPASVRSPQPSAGGVLRLPLIKNKKTVNPRDSSTEPVFQLVRHGGALRGQGLASTPLGGIRGSTLCRHHLASALAPLWLARGTRVQNLPVCCHACVAQRATWRDTPPPSPAGLGGLQETAMGSAIECFDDAGAVVVPRSRFAPVKTCNDLFALRSGACGDDPPRLDPCLCSRLCTRACRTPRAASSLLTPCGAPSISRSPAIVQPKNV